MADDGRRINSSGHPGHRDGRFRHHLFSVGIPHALPLVPQAVRFDVRAEPPHPKYTHLLEPLPEEIIDSAFFDRVHGYIPGWEIPMISPASVATGVGFVIDYFGEMLVRMREDSFADRVRDVALQPGLTRRDQTAIERVGSGLMKLLYPDGNATDEELREVVALACELRQRVHDQLSKLAPGEFKPKTIAAVVVPPPVPVVVAEPHPPAPSP